MPRYVFINDGVAAVPLPPPLSGLVQPKSNLTLDTHAVNVDTPLMRKLLNRGLLRMMTTVNSDTIRGISDHIEIPVVDMIGQGFLRFLGAWGAGTPYAPNDVVTYDDTAWVALLASTGITPTPGPYWTPLVTPSSGGWNRVGIELTSLDPRIFSTPEKFVHVVGGMTIEVFDNGGRRLRQAASPSPLLGDYTVAESGGVGTGYDQVRMLTFSPGTLVVNYRAA